jgi:methyl-accepting chemotaxis protein
MGQITAASKQQSDDILQVNQAIGQMDEVTQQNAALVEEATASAESMQDQAVKLARTVSVFKLSGKNASVAAVMAHMMPPAMLPAATVVRLGAK